MDPALRTSTARAAQQRLRFEALRRRVFSEQEEGSARWRLTWMVPFQVGIVALLVLSGESRGRAVAQVIVVGINSLLFVLRTRSRPPGAAQVRLHGRHRQLLRAPHDHGRPREPAAHHERDDARRRGLHHPRPALAQGHGVPALLRGHARPVASSGTRSSPPSRTRSPTRTASRRTYVALALGSAVFVMVGVYRMGCTMTHGYERVAFELAERREELCSESEDRTRALEGLAARLAHEVKNPLAAIKGLSTHMARSATDPEGRRAPRHRRRPRPTGSRRSSTASSRSRAASTTSSSRPIDAARGRARARRAARDARRGGGRDARGDGRRGARPRRRRPQAPPGAAEPRAQRDAGLAARRDRQRSRSPSDCEGALHHRAATTASA